MTEPYALLIVGGGPAGLSAARAFRGAGGTGGVAIVSDEHRVPYSRPPLTKGLLRGESPESELPIESEQWLRAHGIELIGGRVVEVDPGGRVATMSGGRELRYANCLLATGAEPTRLPVPGADDPRVGVVRSLDHVRELNARLRAGSEVIVIGSGFIGCEIASSLSFRGHRVRLVSDEPWPNAARLGGEAGEILADWLAQDGIELHLGEAVSAIEHAADAVSVFAGTHRIEGHLVVMAAGVSPRSELAAGASIELRDRAVPVDASMWTEREGLLAAGDVCEARNATANRGVRVEHWGDALEQGEVAGISAAGRPAAWSSVPGFWSTIGTRTLKYAAWGDGYDSSTLERHNGGGFTAWYGAGGKIVGVLAHCADDDYERGRRQIADGTRWSL